MWVHFLITSFLLVFVACYLIQYGVCRAIAAGKNNVHFPYTFDPVYVLAGFAAWFIYLALATGILTLFFVLIRKFRLYAAVFFSTLLICAFASPEKTIGVLAPAVEFFTKENRIEIFLLKGFLVWVILLFAGMLLNKYTVYYRSRLRITRHTVPVTILCLLLAGGFGSFFAISSMRVYTETENNVSGETSEEISEPASWDKELVIDISALPKGSDIEVKANSNITLVPDNYDSIGSHWDENAFFEYADGTRIEVPEGNLTFEFGHELENIQGDTITLHYGFYHEMVNGIEAGSFMNPSLEARLEGSTLYLDYNYEKMSNL